MLIDPAKFNIKAMSREELSFFVHQDNEIQYKNYIAAIGLRFYFDRYTRNEKYGVTTLVGPKGSDQGIRAIAKNEVQITKDDIEYLTDYENNRELIDEKTGVRNLNIGDYDAWLNDYVICIKEKQGGRIYFLPILKYYREKDDPITRRHPVLSELIPAVRMMDDEIDDKFEILKQVYEELEKPKGKSEVVYVPDLPDSDRKEWSRIIQNNRDERYSQLNTLFRNGSGLPFAIFRVQENGKRIPLDTKDITINAWFAINGLPRINYVKGKLYINNKEVDKEKYYEKNLVA